MREQIKREKIRQNMKWAKLRREKKEKMRPNKSWNKLTNTTKKEMKQMRRNETTEETRQEKS